MAKNIGKGLSGNSEAQTAEQLARKPKTYPQQNQWTPQSLKNPETVNPYTPNPSLNFHGATWPSGTPGLGFRIQGFRVQGSGFRDRHASEPHRGLQELDSTSADGEEDVARVGCQQRLANHLSHRQNPVLAPLSYTSIDASTCGRRIKFEDRIYMYMAYTYKMICMCVDIHIPTHTHTHTKGRTYLHSFICTYLRGCQSKCKD